MGEFVLGEAENKEEAVENININKALTESLTNASAAEVQDILASVQPKQQPEPGAGPSQTEAPSSSIQLRASTTEREYTVLFDDDDPLPSSEDDDYQPHNEGLKPKIPTPKKRKKKKKSFDIVEDKELESLIEDSLYIIPVVDTTANSTNWTSSIGKLDITLDLERHRQHSIQLPQRPEFW